MNLRRKGLAREIAIVLVLKVAAIAAIWALFFTPAQPAARSDPATLERHLFKTRRPYAPAAETQPMIDLDVVNLSRLQFGLTAMYHFLFVPLTIGLSVLMAIMESVYVMTGRAIWRDMTRFWGKLFGINFAMGDGDRHHAWSSSSAPTGRTTRTMSATSSGCRSPSRE